MDGMEGEKYGPTSKGRGRKGRETGSGHPVIMLTHSS